MRRGRRRVVAGPLAHFDRVFPRSTSRRPYYYDSSNPFSLNDFSFFSSRAGGGPPSAAALSAARHEAFPRWIPLAIRRDYVAVVLLSSLSVPPPNAALVRTFWLFSCFLVDPVAVELVQLSRFVRLCADKMVSFAFIFSPLEFRVIMRQNSADVGRWETSSYCLRSLLLFFFLLEFVRVKGHAHGPFPPTQPKRMTKYGKS